MFMASCSHHLELLTLVNTQTNHLTKLFYFKNLKTLILNYEIVFRIVLKAGKNGTEMEPFGACTNFAYISAFTYHCPCVSILLLFRVNRSVQLQCVR